ncbi:hypothetical protein Psfp_00656 [Pelotomaculum sp. FP]|nr:hypothetical protein Psfp_00656 [Pelotomaculum sp. FP]
MKSKTSSYYRIKYERIAKRRGKKRAIIAIARMMLTAVYHMLQTGEVFNPCDLFQVDIPIELRDRQREKALKQASAKVELNYMNQFQIIPYYLINSFLSKEEK